MTIMIIMMRTRTEVFNVTSGSWRQLATLNVGRGMHACALYNGILVIVVIIMMIMSIFVIIFRDDDDVLIEIFNHPSAKGPQELL